MTLRSGLLSLLLVTALAGEAQAADPVPPPQALAREVAAQLVVEARAARARSVSLTLSASPDLAGVPALYAIATALERALDDERLDARPDVAADMEATLVLTRSAGRVALGGAVHSRAIGTTTYALASAPESPEWAPWLAGLAPIAADASGFVWTRVSGFAGEVLDADAGDLDGDGYAEFVAVTREEAIVFRIDGRDATVVSRTPLAATEMAAVATRAPRAFVRVVPGAGGAGEVLVRLTDELRTRVLVWSTADKRLAARGERDGAIVLASRPTPRGSDVLSADTAAGTNHFEAPPRVKRGATTKTPAGLGLWLDLREADLTATARIAEAGATFALLDAEGALRLLRSDLSEVSRVACGSAFALADWDGDSKPEPLCASAAATTDASDTLSLTGAVSWTGSTDGPVLALAAGPQPVGTAALAFAKNGTGTSVWLLRRTR